MIHDQNVFELEGNTPEEIQRSLEKHIEARKHVIKLTNENQRRFESPESNFKINGKDSWDSLNHPGNAQYCLPLTLSIMGRACQDPATIANDTAPATPFYRENHIWIPGDWGHIYNENFVEKKWKDGHEGENIIAHGSGKFWGHINDDAAKAAIALQDGKTGGPTIAQAQTVLTLNDWFSKIRRWTSIDGKTPGKPKVKRSAHYPSNGLKNPATQNPATQNPE